MMWMIFWILDFVIPDLGFKSSIVQMCDSITSFVYSRCLEPLFGQYEWFKLFENDPNTLVVSFILAVVILVIVTIVSMRLGRTRDIVKHILPDPSLPRFRKRDRVMYLGNKILRKVRSNLQGTQLRGKKRAVVLKFAKKFLRMRREQHNVPELLVTEPSQAFLEEEDVFDSPESHFPDEVLYMIKNIRVFGFFEKPLFLRLCKNMESIPLKTGEFLFNVGDTDDAVYIVQSGQILTTLNEPDGSVVELKTALPGDAIASMLSVLDVLTGNPSVFKTLAACALTDAIVLKLKVSALKEIIDEYPEMLIRVVAIIMVRLHRVIFTSMHKYLGLTSELINSEIQNKRFFPDKNPLIKAPVAATGRVTRYHSRSYSTTAAIDLSDLAKIDLETEAARQSGVNHPSSDSSFGRPSNVVDSLSSADSSALFSKQRKKTIPSYGEDRTLGLKPDEMLDFVAHEMHQILKIKNLDLLRSAIKIKELKRDVILVNEESNEEAQIILLLYGQLIVSQKCVDTKRDKSIFVVNPGELVGALGVLTGEESVFTVRTRVDCKVAIVDRDIMYKIMEAEPEVSLRLAHTVIDRLSPFVRQIDFALDWVHYESGRAIYRVGDPTDSLFIVLNGRLRSVATLANGKKELIGEYGKGDLVGIVEAVTRKNRFSTVMAVRDTELAKLSDGLLEAIRLKFPAVVQRLVLLLGNRVLTTESGQLQLRNRISEPNSRPTGSNFATVAILPVDGNVPLEAFCLELHAALADIGTAVLLTSQVVRETLGPRALDRSSEYRLCSWLSMQEDTHKIALYQCDRSYTNWTQRCIRQADCILIVGMGDQEPTVGEVERQLAHLSARTTKELVLLHRMDGPRPKNTVAWLNMRDWCSSNHHIRCPQRVFIRRPVSKIQQFYAQSRVVPSIHSDIARLARFLTGQSMGLVLGGGGARGAAHCGMIKVLCEEGIPIDMIGGVSIGAFMGALWAMEADVTTFVQKAHKWAMGMTSYWRQILDLTYPTTAMFTGHAFNQSIYEVFGDTQIEDLWLPYFTVTTDITHSAPRIHRHGSLWRYVRASMSLSGYLPPMCDPLDGALLLDGGYVNNLPADVMREVMGAKEIVAIDVGAQDDKDLTNYGDTLSGWQLLWRRWNPFVESMRVPNLPEIQSRLAYVSCVRILEDIKSNPDRYHYIRPPIDNYKTLQFKSFTEIMTVGYNHGKRLFAPSSITTAFREFVERNSGAGRKASVAPIRSSHSHQNDILSHLYASSHPAAGSRSSTGSTLSSRRSSQTMDSNRKADTAVVGPSTLL